MMYFKFLILSNISDDDTEMDREISREIDVLLQNVQNSL